MFRYAHTNVNVTDIEKSAAFYAQALGLRLRKEKTTADGSARRFFMTDEQEIFEIELTWFRDKKGPYDLGDNERHVCFSTNDMIAAHALHEEMDAICFENAAMGLYFIEDPDGYWIEIVPRRKDGETK